MAKCKAPLFSESASGSLQGIEFRAGIYGPMCGRTSSGAQPRTPNQLTARARLASAHRAFEALTSAQQHAWQIAAKPTETARAAFIAAFLRLQPLTGSPPTRAITAYAIRNVPPIHPTFRIIGGHPNLYLYHDDLATNLRLAVYIYLTWSGRTSPTPSKLRFWASKQLSQGYVTANLPYKAPICHARCDLISPDSGTILSSASYRWPTGW